MTQTESIRRLLQQLRAERIEGPNILLRIENDHELVITHRWRMGARIGSVEPNTFASETPQATAMRRITHAPDHA
jgi:hypothetical protein